MSNRHPGGELLLEYTAGSCSLEMAACIRTHLDYCTACRSQVARLNEVGQLAFESLPREPVAEHLFDQIMARIDFEEQSATKAGLQTAAREQESFSIERLPEILAGSWEGLEWKRQWFGVFEHLLSVTTDGSRRLALHRIKAGASAPDHGHHGREVTVVLKGRFEDQFGLYEPGDFIVMSSDSEHRPRALREEDCICLALQEGPARLTGWLGFVIERLRSFLMPHQYGSV